MANSPFSWQQDNKHLKGSLCFSSLLWVINPEICALQPESHIPRQFLCVSYVCSQAWQEQCSRNLTNVQIRLSPRLLNRGRKRILSQNKRWGANPFPCAVKQSLHSLLSKWHLIWFCCWSLRYPESFQDIYSGCCTTLVRYEGGEIWWAVTKYHSHECAHRHTPDGKHPEIKPQVAGLISQDTPGHVRRWWKYKLG